MEIAALRTIAASVFLVLGFASPSFGSEALPDVENVVNGYAVAVLGSEECEEIRSIPDAKRKLGKIRVFTAVYAVKSGLSESEFEGLLDEAGINGFLLLQLDKEEACRMAMKKCLKRLGSPPPVAGEDARRPASRPSSSTYGETRQHLLISRGNFGASRHVAWRGNPGFQPAGMLWIQARADGRPGIGTGGP